VPLSRALPGCCLRRCEYYNLNKKVAADSLQMQRGSDGSTRKRCSARQPIRTVRLAVRLPVDSLGSAA